MRGDDLQLEIQFSMKGNVFDMLGPVGIVKEYFWAWRIYNKADPAPPKYAGWRSRGAHM